MDLNEGFRKFSSRAANTLGSPWLFVVSLLLIVIWIISGPFAHFSDTWQLLINTATTVFTFLAVFLIQNTQNRDAKAMHLKLDELIHAVHGARNQLVDLEDLSDEELEKLQEQFKRLRQQATGNGDKELASEELAEIDAVEILNQHRKRHAARHSSTSKKHKKAVGQ
jgi:low affinity Fe/Cu permease